jgi:hypothetical protein
MTDTEQDMQDTQVRLYKFVNRDVASTETKALTLAYRTFVCTVQ